MIKDAPLIFPYFNELCCEMEYKSNAFFVIFNKNMEKYVKFWKSLQIVM